jgi:extracellular factor (EF) 3-hydroxypalmitic acid methyl ester biosynthesis protein
MLAKDNSIQSTGLALMDEAQSLLVSGDVQKAMDLVFLGMKSIKENFNQFEWNQFTKTTCLEHSLIDLVHQCPFTYHAFTKPRGYAGDAELIDFIYGFKQPPDVLTKMGGGDS